MGSLVIIQEFVMNLFQFEGRNACSASPACRCSSCVASIRMLAIICIVILLSSLYIEQTFSSDPKVQITQNQPKQTSKRS